MYELIKTKPVFFPDAKKHGISMSDNCKAFISACLEKNPTKRLGLEGKYTEWFFSGEKRCEGLMRHDKMDGKWFFWYSNGQIALECDFDYGNLINNAKIYHDNGLLKEEVKL